MLGLAAHGQVPRKDGASSEPQGCRLSYEPLECPRLEVLAESGFRKELGGDQRAAKRRRVEALAEQYLRGKPIYIRSVLGPFDGRWINPWDKGPSDQRKESNTTSQMTTVNEVAHHRTYVARRPQLSDDRPEKSKAVHHRQMSLNKEPPEAERGERWLAQQKQKQKSMEAKVQGTTVKVGSNSQQAGRRTVETHRDVHTWLRKMSEAESDSHIEEEAIMEVALTDRGTPSKMPQGHEQNRRAQRNSTTNGKRQVRKEYEETWEPRRKARKKPIAINNSEAATRPSKETHSASPPVSSADSVQPPIASKAAGKDRHWVMPEAERSSGTSAEYVEGFVGEVDASKTGGERLGQVTNILLEQQRDSPGLSGEATARLSAPNGTIRRTTGLSASSRAQPIFQTATFTKSVPASESIAHSKSRKSPLEKQGPSQALPPSTHLPEFRFRRTRASDRLRHKAALVSVEDHASKTGAKKMKITAPAPIPNTRAQKLDGPILPVSDACVVALSPNAREAESNSIIQSGRGITDAEILYGQVQPLPAAAPPEQIGVADGFKVSTLGSPAEVEGPHAQAPGATGMSGSFERTEGQAEAAAIRVEVVRPEDVLAQSEHLISREDVATTHVQQRFTAVNGEMGPPPVRGSPSKPKKSAVNMAPLQDSNFCTQAAMVEAEQAFQAVLESPVKASLMGPHSPSKGSPSVTVSRQRRSEAIKLFQAFQTASDDVSDMPPISTQQLFDEADLNFASTVKKTKGKKRTSFAPSPTFEKGRPEHVDESFENLDCSIKRSVDLVALDTAHQSPAIVATPAAMTSISLSQPIEAAALTAIPSNSRLLSPRIIDRQATVPSDSILKDGNASFEESTQLPRLESGLTLPDEELDATVSCLDSYLNTWKIEREVNDIQLSVVPKSTGPPDDSSFACISIKKSSFRARRGGLSYKPAGRLKP